MKTELRVNKSRANTIYRGTVKPGQMFKVKECSGQKPKAQFFPLFSFAHEDIQHSLVPPAASHVWIRC